MNLIPFREILKSALGDDVDIYVFHLPDTVSEGILLLHNLSGARLDPNLPDYKKAKFQIIVRNPNFESGYALAKQAMDAFKVVKRYSDGVMLINFIEPLHDPVSYPSSKGNFIEFSVNFETAYVEH